MTTQKTKTEFVELLSMLKEDFGQILENECNARVKTEVEMAIRNHDVEQERMLEPLSRIQISSAGGLPEQMAASQQAAARRISTLMRDVEAFAKGKAPLSGEFPKGVIAAIYYGSECRKRLDEARPELFKYVG